MDIFSVFVELSFPPLYHAMLVDLCAVIYVPFWYLCTRLKECKQMKLPEMENTFRP